MSVNLNPQRNLSFGARNEDKGSVFPPVIAGAVVGGLTGWGIAKSRDPIGQISDIPADKFISKNIKKRIAQEGASALTSDQKRTAKDALKAYSQKLKTLRESHRLARKEGGKSLEDAKKAMPENIKKIREGVANVLKDGSKPTGKFAGIGAAIGAAVLLAGHFIFGKSSSTSAAGKLVISSSDMTHS